MRVLVVDDDDMLADAVGEGLRGANLAVDVVYDGSTALERCAVNAYDVVVLDRDLPGVHGDVVCRTLTEGPSEARILLLTAAATVPERVYGLESGADDYLPKPFAFTELIARVRALGRRSRPASPPVVERAGIRLDTARQQVVREGRPVPLSRKEFAVLDELLRADGAVVPAEHLLEKVWDEHIDPFSNVVRVTMVGLRRKLAAPAVIETVSKVGYRIP